jgi:hypothetical protein
MPASDDVRESPRGMATLPQFGSKQEPGANHARPRSERPRQRSQGGQLRMEPLWNVMKKGLLAGDTLR